MCADWVTLLVVYIPKETETGEPNYRIGSDCAAVHNCNSCLEKISIVIANKRHNTKYLGAKLLFLPSKGIKHVITPSYANDKS